MYRFTCEWTTRPKCCAASPNPTMGTVADSSLYAVSVSLAAPSFGGLYLRSGVGK